MESCALLVSSCLDAYEYANIKLFVDETERQVVATTAVAALYITRARSFDMVEIGPPWLR